MIFQNGGRFGIFISINTSVVLIGLAACNAWARTKHFGCPSVIPSVCYPGIPL